MTERDALLKAIIAAPDDDLPRLVYADWLDEHADPREPERAEFIRVQCELAKVFNPESGRYEVGESHLTLVEFRALERRERELWRLGSPPAAAPQVAVGWNTLIPGLKPESETFRYSPCATYRRGFVESIVCPAADWLAHADAITAAHPVRRVRLTTRPTLDCFARDGLWARLPGRKSVVSQFHPGRGSVERTEAEAASALLAAEWPGITFELPPADPLHPFYEAGRRAAVARNRAVMDAFLDPPPEAR